MYIRRERGFSKGQSVLINNVTASIFISVFCFFSQSVLAQLVRDKGTYDEPLEMFESDQKNVITVTFDPGKNGHISDIAVLEIIPGEVIEPPAVEANSGYVFTGWNKPLDQITSDTIVTALYNEAFNVSFNIGEYAETKDDLVVNVAAGGFAKAPKLSVTKGYVFLGWDYLLTSIRADLTATALYTKEIPFREKSFLWLDSNGAAVDDNGTVTHWKNLVDDTDLFPAGDGYITFDIKSIDNTPAVRFSGNSYFGFENLDKEIGPATLFVVYNREATQNASHNEIFFSSFDDDNKGFYCSIENNKGYVATTITSSVNELCSLRQISIGGDGDGEIGYNGSISEIIIYDHILTPEEIDIVEDYLKSKWISYVVTFDNGLHGKIDKGNKTQIVFHKSMPEAPIIVPDPGYIFIGWDQPFDFLTTDLDLTAQYRPLFNVIFKSGLYGSFSSGKRSQRVAEGDAALPPVVVPNTGYSFAGWDTFFGSVNKDITVTAKYNDILCNVSFYPGRFGTLKHGISKQSVKYGKNAIAPEIIATDGYKFLGWDKSYKNVNKDITVEARYEIDVTNGIPIPPVFFPKSKRKGLYLWLDSGFGITSDNNGNITHWSNLVTSEGTTSINGISQLSTNEKGHKSVIQMKGRSSLNLMSDNDIVSDITVFAACRSKGTNMMELSASSLVMNKNVKNHNQTFRINEIVDENLRDRSIIYPLNNMAGPVFLKRSLRSIEIGKNFVGDIYEVLIYNKILTKSEQSEVRNYLKKKWFSYVVTFDAGKYGVITSSDSMQTVAYGKAAAEPASLNVNDGWKFTGWSKEFDSITGDTRVTANYEAVVDTISISLKKGFNLVSLRVLPEGKRSMETIITKIASELDYVTDSKQNICSYNGSWKNTIGDWEPTKGYLIKVSADTMLSVTGPPVDFSSPINLSAGVHFIPSIGDYDPLVYFGSILDKIDFVRDDKGKIMKPSNGEWINDIGMLKPGKAYVVKIRKETSFFFPSK